jgi:hypothetical protein
MILEILQQCLRFLSNSELAGAARVCVVWKVGCLFGRVLTPLGLAILR